MLDAEARFAPLSRRLLSVLAVAFSALLTLAVAQAPAADIGHSFSGSFQGSGTNALSTGITSVEVDNSGGPSQGDVYVTDATEHRVVKYDSAGVFILMFGDGVNSTTGADVCTAASGNTCKAGTPGTAADQLTTPTWVAVDSSSSPSKGDVYVGDTEGNTIHKYTEGGVLVTGWGTGGYIDGSSSGGSFPNLSGIDVNPVTGQLMAFSSNGGNFYLFSQASDFVEALSPCRGHESFGAAFDPTGTKFFKVNGDATIERYVPGGECIQITDNGLGQGTKGLNVDQVTGTLFRVEGTRVGEWKFDSEGKVVDGSNSPCPNLESCPATHNFGENEISEAKGVGINSATNTVYVADSGNHRIAVFSAALAPLPVTEEPVANTTVSGTVKPDGAGTVVECYFEYALASDSYSGLTVPCSPAPNYTVDTAVTALLPGLEGEVTYKYRLVAKNAAGAKNFGSEKMITPHNVKGLTTEAATAITRTGAHLNASFEGDGTPTTYYFEWGTSPNPPLTNKTAVENAGSPSFPPKTALTFSPTGLKPETTYYFRVVAQNTTGKSPAQVLSFTTLPAVQSLTTAAATDVAPRSATLNGSYLGDGDATTYFFEWGKTTNYTGGKTPETSAGSPSGTKALAFDLANLELEQVYHYRVVAKNSLGETKGLDQTFTTAPAVAGVATLPATDLSQEGVTLHGQFSGNGDATSYYFEWGPTTAYGNTTALPPGDPAGSPTGTTPLEAELVDFEGFTTYHYRLVAVNSLGVTKGNDETVTTEPAPAPIISGTAVSGVSPTGATLSAAVNPNRWKTIYTFEYGTTTDYEFSTPVGDPIDGNGNSAVPISEVLAELTPGTIYHFRSVATNFTGTVHSDDQTFITPDAPKFESSSAGATGLTTAHLAASLIPNASPTNARFEFGTTTAYGGTTTPQAVGDSLLTQSVGADLSGLTAGTTYHARAVATNGIGTTYGADMTFTTKSEPAVVAAPEKKCKKGFVKRKGKCVKKKQKKPHRHKSNKRSANG